MFIAPMLLQTRATPFSDDNYIFEPKIDGHRLILSRSNGVTHLYTRHNNDVTRQYPELLDITVDDVILDGEVACMDTKTGAIDFESVMERFSAGKAAKIARLAAKQPVNFIVFDVLRLNGQDLRGLPLEQRKEILGGLTFGNAHIATIPFVEADGERLYDEICARKMEGIVAKRANSVYVSQRSPAWLKIINWTHVDVVITGYRKKEFGWLCAVDAGDERLKPGGIIELGVTPAQKMAFYNVRTALTIGEDKDNVYLAAAFESARENTELDEGGAVAYAGFRGVY